VTGFMFNRTPKNLVSVSFNVLPSPCHSAQASYLARKSFGKLEEMRELFGDQAIKPTQQ
jgi:hypothetical protein